MNQTQRKRLLNVAKACRETKHPEDFDMAVYAHSTCGTPGCALGNYAARRDLQRSLRLFIATDETHLPSWHRSPVALQAEDGRRVGYDHEYVHEHFGINHHEAEQLFSSEGCDEAQTPLEAAEYIEAFVAERCGEAA